LYAAGVEIGKYLSGLNIRQRPARGRLGDGANGKQATRDVDCGFVLCRSRGTIQMAHILRIFFFLIGCVIAANCSAQVAPAPRDLVPGLRGDPFPLASLVYQWNYTCPNPNGAGCVSGIGPGSAISLTLDLFAFTPGSIETWTYYYDFVALVVQGGPHAKGNKRLYTVSHGVL
jgi:hypothetical protein